MDQNMTACNMSEKEQFTGCAFFNIKAIFTQGTSKTIVVITIKMLKEISCLMQWVTHMPFAGVTHTLKCF